MRTILDARFLGSMCSVKSISKTHGHGSSSDQEKRHSVIAHPAQNLEWVIGALNKPALHNATEIRINRPVDDRLKRVSRTAFRSIYNI
jgi:hypothetical protein